MNEPPRINHKNFLIKKPSQKSDKITSTSKKPVKQKKYLYFDGFDRKVLMDFIYNWFDDRMRHKHLYHVYSCFKQDENSTTSPIIASSFEQNKEIILTSLKEQHFSTTITLDENSYITIINDILNDKISYENGELSENDIKLIKQLNGTHESLIKAWSNDNLSVTDLNFLNIYRDVTIV